MLCHTCVRILSGAWAHQGTLQLLYSGCLFSRPALLWCHHEGLGQTIAVKRAVRSLTKEWVHTYVYLGVYQDTEPWALRAFQQVTSWNRCFSWALPVRETRFLFKFCCVLAHGDGPSVICNSRNQGAFQKYTNTTFRLSSGTHGQLLVLAVRSRFSGEHQRVKRKDGECGSAVGKNVLVGRTWLLKPLLCESRYRFLWEFTKER